MPTEVKAKTWDECEQKMLSVEEKYRQHEPGVWFRGHSDANWGLLSTLERRSPRMRIRDYYNLIRRVTPEIEALSGHRLDFPELDEFVTADQYDDLLNLLMLGYPSMAYLRHHGFPSPLLDWTASPYVAAYFAFAQALQTDSAAIYVYVERPKRMKVSGSDTPQITALGPIVRTHARHFRQQSRYTVCTTRDSKWWAFTPHDDVFKLPEAQQQDFLWKISIPASERLRVLSKLDRFNLNAYSLFGSEESLMETLAFRELDQRS